MDVMNRYVQRPSNPQRAFRNSHSSSAVIHQNSRRPGLIVVLLFLTGAGSLLVAVERDATTEVPFDVREMDWLQCIAFSPNGKHVAVAGGPAFGSGMLALYDYPSGRRRLLIKRHRQRVSAVGFSPDSLRVASGGGDGENKLWDVRTGRLVADLEGHRLSTYGICFTPDGRQMITCGGLDHSVRVWDVASTRPLATFRFLFTKEAIEDAVRSFPELPRERANLSETFTIPIEMIYAVALSPDGKTIAAATEETCVRFWDPKTGKDRRILRTDHTEGVVAVAFSSDGKKLATGGGAGKNSNVRLWDLATGRKLQSFKGHREWTHQVVFSPDNKTLFTRNSFEDGTAKVWQVETGKELATIRNRDNRFGMHGLAVTPDGKVLATIGGPNSLMFWDLQTFKEVQPWADQKEETPVKEK